MIAEIVAIGDELLHGGLLDTNSKYMAQELERLGAVVRRISNSELSIEKRSWKDYNIFLYLTTGTRKGWILQCSCD